MQGKTVSILLIEDDEVDAMTIKRGFQRARIANQIVRAKDGIEGLELLRGEAKAGELGKPCIILLDLNMPRMNGFEFLDELRNDSALKQTIVFVLTTSKDEKDIDRVYDQNVAGYIVKKEAGKEFLNLIEMIDHYWRVVELP
ncbi:MAG: response regulator [Candidatus Ozemobacteraceae bacterium]